jgi:glycosyltransferase involved in cell wall biosynthesis
VNKQVPDVTVVIAVYNTMPYLTACLSSVFEQTIGVDRLEVVAVDDGSTDESGAELRRWAERHPQTMTVLSQANSGGPAGPSNRALDVATGRYVFFLGADDYLGPEALQRLVDAADELSADIMLGRLVGTGGRNVNQAIYQGGNQDDITLVNSALPWALSNTKLFRRELIEAGKIRYPEQLRSGSDQPFTIRAVAAARRIAVRADYEFYYATRRTDSSNITYRTSLADFVADTELIMDTVAEVVDDPVAREMVLRRHFTWELGKLLGDRFLDATHEERCKVQQGIRKLAEIYLTDAIRASLDVQHRAGLGTTQLGTVDDLVKLAEHRREHGLTPIVAHDGRYFVAYPGFRDDHGFPDEWFECTGQALKREKQAEPAQLSWGRSPDGRPALVISWVTSLPDLGATGEHSRCVTVAKQQPVAAQAESHETGSVVRVALPLDVLVAGRPKRRSRVKFTRTIAAAKRSYELTAADVESLRRRVHRAGRALFLIGATVEGDGELVVTVQPTSILNLAKNAARGVIAPLRKS